MIIGQERLGGQLSMWRELMGYICVWYASSVYSLNKVMGNLVYICKLHREKTTCVLVALNSCQQLGGQYFWMCQSTHHVLQDQPDKPKNNLSIKRFSFIVEYISTHLYVTQTLFVVIKLRGLNNLSFYDV